MNRNLKWYGSDEKLRKLMNGELVGELVDENEWNIVSNVSSL